jgi:hypothetical protein
MHASQLARRRDSCAGSCTARSVLDSFPHLSGVCPSPFAPFLLYFTHLLELSLAAGLVVNIRAWHMCAVARQ